MSDHTLDAPATIRDVAFATALAMVTSIRASTGGDSRVLLESVVESLEVAASASAEMGVNPVLTSIAEYIMIFATI